jgi:sterol-4alpha-carboxylate 3-dehydrogenase (decarboxylating)
VRSCCGYCALATQVICHVAQPLLLLLLALQAADKLSPGSNLAGEAFFITNQHPVPFWGFTGDLLEGLGYGRPHIKLPFALILFVAMLFEYVIRPLLRPIKELSTDFTVFRVRIVTRQRAFSCDKARKMLDYVPAVSLEDAIKRTVKHFEHLRNTDAAAGARVKAS